jgi:hypothetical protein
MINLKAIVSRGQHAGKTLFPHRHADGCYVVSPDRFERNYVRVTTQAEIESFLERGFSLRMSNPAEGIVAASLISPRSIVR